MFLKVQKRWKDVQTDVPLLRKKMFFVSAAKYAQILDKMTIQ